MNDGAGRQFLTQRLQLLVYRGMMLFTQVAFQRFVREHKAGNPDYLKGLNVRGLTPKQITDKHQIFKTIIRK